MEANLFRLIAFLFRLMAFAPSLEGIDTPADALEGMDIPTAAPTLIPGETRNP
jgi:hypothetical protein